jgi:uncharacterized protein DUF6223
MKKSNGIVMGLMAAYIDVYSTHFGFAADLTSGRARSLVGTFVGLISLIAGVMAMRSARRTGNGRRAGMVALVLGLIGVVLDVVHLSTFTGAFGSGSGRAGAIVGLVLALIGMGLGGLAVARSRQSH